MLLAIFLTLGGVGFTRWEGVFFLLHGVFRLFCWAFHEFMVASSTSSWVNKFITHHFLKRTFIHIFLKIDLAN
jgi:hypothetical protein